MALEPIVNIDILRQELTGCGVRATDIGRLTDIVDRMINIISLADEALAEWREGHLYVEDTDPLFRNIVFSLETLRMYFQKECNGHS